METVTPAELPTELAAVVRAGSEAGQDYGPAVAALARLGIVTPIDLHFARFIPPEVDLPNSTLACLRSIARDNLVAPTTTALDLLTSRSSAQQGGMAHLGTCLGPLDRILGGGYPARSVIEIAGPPRSGRTLLLFHAALAHLLKHPAATCCWLDTKGTFGRDVTRTVDIINALVAGLRREGRAFRTAAGEEMDGDAIVGATLERLLISLRVEREGALETIATCVGGATAERRVELIVIDSIDTILEAGQSQGTRAQAYASQVDFVRRLSAYTQDPSNPVTIFVANSAVEQPAALAPVSVLPNPSRAPLLRPALGTTFAFLPDLTLWLTRGEKAWGRTGEGTAVVEVVANRAGRRGEWVAFKTDGVTIQALE